MKFLVAGLGNIGDEYKNTRHNAGFIILDHFANKHNVSFTIGRYAACSEMKIKNRQIFLIKPSTYMNLSGKAIDYWLKKMDIPLTNLLVVVDDLALPLAKIRIKQKGGDGGHNGLIDIISRLNTDNFCRLRFGIGKQYNQGNQVDYVLGEWSIEEKAIITEKLDFINEAILCWVLEGVESAMTKFNNN